MTSQGAAILDFQIKKKIEMTRKQLLAIEIYKIVRIHCKVVCILSLFSEKLKFCSQHANCVTYYDDVMRCEEIKRCVNEKIIVVQKILTIGKGAKF